MSITLKLGRRLDRRLVGLVIKLLTSNWCDLEILNHIGPIVLIESVQRLKSVKVIFPQVDIYVQTQSPHTLCILCDNATMNLHFKIVSIQIPTVDKLFRYNSIYMFENRNCGRE